MVLQASTVAMDTEQKKKRTFKKFTYRGVDLDKLLDMSPKDLMELVDVSVSFVVFENANGSVGPCPPSFPPWS